MVEPLQQIAQVEEIPSSRQQDAGTDPTAALINSDPAAISLTGIQLEELGTELCEICRAYDEAMMQRIQRWQDINDSYNLVPNANRQGEAPGAQRLVSEMTRSYTKVAASRLNESLRGVRPFVNITATDENADDDDTITRARIAETLETFLEEFTWGDLRGQIWIPLALLSQCKLGTRILKVGWRSEKKVHHYIKDGGDLASIEEETGRPEVVAVRNSLVRLWPLTENDIEDMAMFGHKAFFTRSNFKAFTKSLGATEEETEQMMVHESSGAGTHVDETQAKNLRGQDIDDPSVDHSLNAEFSLTELWCNFPLPGDKEASKFVVHVHEPTKRIVYIGKNTYNCQRHPFFDLQYWREDDCFWGNGVGQELLYCQAGDEALLNMLIDNLKQMGNHLRLIRANSQAEALQDEIGPGMNVATEDPENDVNIVPLGGDLDHIYEAIESNSKRADAVTGINAPNRGLADPVLKSGASPTSQGQLMASGEKTFRQVDRNTRDTFSELFMFVLEMVQQYATDGLWYNVMSRDSSRIMRRLKLDRPFGNLRTLYRITARAPNAATTQEAVKQNLMMLSSIAMQHTEKVLQLAQMTWQGDPMRFQELSESMLEFNVTMFGHIVEQHEIPGLTAETPKLPDETVPAVKMVTDRLLGQIQELQGQLESLAEEQMTQGGPANA